MLTSLIKDIHVNLLCYTNPSELMLQKVCILVLRVHKEVGPSLGSCYSLKRVRVIFLKSTETKVGFPLTWCGHVS